MRDRPMVSSPATVDSAALHFVIMLLPLLLAAIEPLVQKIQLTLPNICVPFIVRDKNRNKT